MGKNKLSQEINLADEINRQYGDFVNELQKTLEDNVEKQITLARAAGVNPSSISNLITKGTIPTFENLYKILYAYLGRPPITLTPADDTRVYQQAISQIKSIISSIAA